MNRDEYQLIRSKRKTIAVEIKPDLSVIVRAPMRLSDARVKCFVKEKEAWIQSHLELMRQRMAVADQTKAEKFTPEELQQLANQAKNVIPEKVSHFAKLLNVSYNRITIRNQKTRWGSCSEKGNLNFNCLLMLMPEEIIDYVVIHELCHRLEMNHSKNFWALVEGLDPAYKTHRKWIKDHGAQYIRRL